MQLIGMLDSPYVRRVAIVMRLLGLPFEHRPLSVFRTYDEFARINPAVKAPTLVCDDGSLLMDSSLIIDYLEALAGRSLWPASLPQRQAALRLAGQALTACEKSVQIVYEHELRPEASRHLPWLKRVQVQQHAAFHAMEAEYAAGTQAELPALDHGGIAAAVAWRFAHLRPVTAEGTTGCVHLASYVQACERLAPFAQIPADERVECSTAAR